MASEFWHEHKIYQNITTQPIINITITNVNVYKDEFISKQISDLLQYTDKDIFNNLSWSADWRCSDGPPDAIYVVIYSNLLHCLQPMYDCSLPQETFMCSASCGRSQQIQQTDKTWSIYPRGQILHAPLPRCKASLLALQLILHLHSPFHI